MPPGRRDICLLQGTAPAIHGTSGRGCCRLSFPGRGQSMHTVNQKEFGGIYVEGWEDKEVGPGRGMAAVPSSSANPKESLGTPLLRAEDLQNPRSP